MARDAADMGDTKDIGAAQRAVKPSGESFRDAYARNRSEWMKGKGGPTFMHDGKEYSVASREEAAANKAMRESPNRGRGMNRASPPSAPSRAGAVGAMADRAAKDARDARAASESRAANPYNDRSRRKDTVANAQAASRGESTSGMGSKITNRPAPGAKSIYEDSGVEKTLGAAAAVASALPAVRKGKALVEGAVEGAKAIGRAVGARTAAKKAGSEMVRDPDRVNFANGGLVRRATAKSHGKAC